ncbi:MAG: tetratricopeptide repeat protein [Elusimicrobiota bacterium]
MSRASGVLALIVALSLGAAPARAWRLFGEPSDGKIRPVQKLSDEHKPAEVLARLTPEYIQTLRGTDLRQAYVLMGDSHVALNRPAEALGDYQLGVSLFPKNVDLLTRLAALLHTNGLDEQAKPLFLTALQYEPRHWGAHLGLAEIDHRFGFLDRSAEHYEIALEVLDKRVDVWCDYAEVLLALRDTATAELALRKALALDPRSANAHLLLAFSRRDSGDMPGAIGELDAAQGLGAGAGARRAKALFLLEAGRLQEAGAEAAAVLSANPGDGAALWVRARVLLASGDEAGAALALTAVKNVEGNNAFAAQAARALRDSYNK